MNPEALNTGDSDLSLMAADSHQGPEEKRCGELMRLLSGVQAGWPWLCRLWRTPVTNNKSPGQPDKSQVSHFPLMPGSTALSGFNNRGGEANDTALMQ